MNEFTEEGQTAEVGYWTRDIRREETDAPRGFHILGKAILHKQEERAYFCSFVLDIRLISYLLFPFVNYFYLFY